MIEDNWSLKDSNGRKIDSGMPYLIQIVRWILLLITFPLRVFFFFLNPFPTKDGTPRQIKIRK
jgi:hypothetical protein